MSYRTVDLSKLKSFVPPGVFIRIDPRIEKKISAYPEMYERMEGCVAFCGSIGHLDIDENPAKDVHKRRKYLRAALAEYASLDEAAALDFAVSSTKVAPSMLSLDDPRLHVVRLLRHANVHLSANDVDNTSRPAMWDGPDGTVEFNYHVFYVPDLEVSIKSTSQASKYNPSDLLKMINWVEKEQMEWGINHLILRTAELYARVLLKEGT